MERNRLHLWKTIKSKLRLLIQNSDLKYLVSFFLEFFFFLVWEMFPVTKTTNSALRNGTTHGQVCSQQPQKQQQRSYPASCSWDQTSEWSAIKFYCVLQPEEVISGLQHSCYFIHVLHLPFLIKHQFTIHTTCLVPLHVNV